jgi:hypothetical protein
VFPVVRGVGMALGGEEESAEQGVNESFLQSFCMWVRFGFYFFQRKIKPWFYSFDCEIVVSSLKNM